MSNLSPQLYKLIAEKSPDVLYLLDFEEKFLFVSDSIKSVFGYEPGEVIGRKIQNFLLPKSYEMQKKGLEKVFKEKSFDRSEKMLLRAFRKDGKKIWLEAHARMILGDDGAPIAILGVIRNVDSIEERFENE